MVVKFRAFLFYRDTDQLRMSIYSNVLQFSRFFYSMCQGIFFFNIEQNYGSWLFMFLFFVFCFLPFLEPLPWHIEVPRPGTESELQLHDLHHSCGNTGSFHTLHWARDQTGASEATRVTAFGFLTHCAIAGTPKIYLFNFQIFLVLFMSLLCYCITFYILMDTL